MRLIALTHDSFKHLVDRSKPRVGENHHGMIARRFTERYSDDHEVLEIIELHDEAFNAWAMGRGRLGCGEKQSNARTDSLSVLVLRCRCIGASTGVTTRPAQSPRSPWHGSRVSARKEASNSQCGVYQGPVANVWSSGPGSPTARSRSTRATTPMEPEFGSWAAAVAASLARHPTTR